MTYLAQVLAPIAIGLATLASALAIGAVYALGEIERIIAKEKEHGTKDSHEP